MIQINRFKCVLLNVYCFCVAQISYNLINIININFLINLIMKFKKIISRELKQFIDDYDMYSNQTSKLILQLQHKKSKIYQTT